MAEREFPKSPLLGVGGVVIHRGRVLLVRRGHAPLKGKWSIPGGLVELGEKLQSAVRRELKEETGLVVEPVEIVAVIDRIQRARRRVRYHFVIVDYYCRLKGGKLQPASDVSDARWLRPEGLSQFNLNALARRVILEAFRWARKKRTA
jgi:8-oxo-dGTP diphosphatase